MTLEYQITKIEKYPRFTEYGSIQYVYRIYFKVPQLGVEDFIEVPESQYRTDIVRKLILEKIKTYEDLMGRSSA